MHADKHLKWLEEKKLLEESKTTIPAIKRVFEKCLAAKDEHILIITDQGFKNKRVAGMLSGSYYLAAKELGLTATIIIQDPKFRGEKASQDVLNAFYDLRKKSIVILSLSSKLGSIKDLGGSFRTYAKENQHRFISSMSLGHLETEKFAFLINSIDVDYDKMREKGNALKKQLDNADEVHITTKKGTDFIYNIKGKEAKVNTGDYTQPGKGGNLPAGEVYIAPKWKHVEGTVIIDGSSSTREGTQLCNEPIKLTIKKDEVIKVEGGVEAKKLESTLDWAYMKAKYPWGIRRVGELGIGINERANIVGATIVDEKTLGTAHIGIGSNYWFGGTIYAIIHLDQIFRNPKIELDGKEIKV